VAAWWGQWPDASVGIHVDGAEGEDTIGAWIRHAGFSVATPASRASQGVKLLYRKPVGVRIGNSVKTVAPGLDVRGDAWLALLPPSAAGTSAPGYCPRR
jgi:hypothetical protein